MTRRRRGWLLALAALGLALVGVAVMRLVRRPKSPTAAQQAAQRVVPVGVVEARKQDVPLWLDGLGSVLPRHQVTVRTRVDGQLDAVLFEEGQTVHEGEPIAQVDPRPFRIALAQAKAALQRDKAQLSNARRNFVRYRQLFSERLVPQQQADDQKAVVAQLVGAVALDQAQVDSAKLQLEWSRVTSPLTGVTGIRQVDPGNLVHPTDPNGLVVITQLDPIDIVFTLPQDALADVKAAARQRALPVEVFSRLGGAPLSHGSLMFIDNLVNPGTATLRLKAEVPNPAHALWPSQFVKVRLYTATREGAVTVPAEALQRGPKGPFVYVVSAEGTAAVREVTVDLVQGPLALISHGLAPGDRVVVDGQSQLKPGVKVQARERPEPTEPPPSRGAGI